MRCLAIDIGGTKIATAIVENNTITQRRQIATPTADSTPRSQTAQRHAMQSALADIVQHYAGQFDAVAVASTGIINQGVLTALNPKNLGGLADFPLLDAIKAHTDKPVGLLNDVQAAVCAEYALEQDVQNYAFITVSTGVGGGLILNGELHTGTHGIAGHIGHSLADPQGAMCGCGRRGCVEAVASGRAIEREAQQWANPCEPKEVFERFRQGDAQATALVEKSANAIAQLVADLVISLDVQKVVIGGSVGLAQGYLPLVEKQLAELPSVYQCPIKPAHWGGDAGLIGAAFWLEQQLNQQ